MSALAFAGLDLDDYAASLNAQMQGRSAEDVLNIAIRDLFPGQIALVSSFGAESAVLLHLAAQTDKATPVLFLDTGKLFEQTLKYRDALIDRLGLSDVRVLTPDQTQLAAQDNGGTLWFNNAEACCSLRKVQPLQRALKPFAAWINGRKRYQAGTRRDIALVEAEGARLKFNPLAGWSAAEIDTYFARHDLPRHPLVAEGYLSIGCATCTHPVVAGQDARSGRWQGREKTECGIHLPIPAGTL